MGKGLGNMWGELMENKSYFNKVCLQNLSWCPLSIFDKSCSSLPGTGEGEIFLKGKFMPCF